MGKRLVHLAEGRQRLVHVLHLNRVKMSSAEVQQVFQVAVASGAARPGRRGRKRKRRPRRYRDANQPLGADFEEPPSAEASADSGGSGAGGEAEKVLYFQAAGAKVLQRFRHRSSWILCLLWK